MLEQLSQLFEFLWGGPLFLCVIGIGFYFTVRLNFFQIINLKDIYRNTIGTLAGKNKQNANIMAAQCIILRKGSIKNGIPWQDYMRLH